MEIILDQSSGRCLMCESKPHMVQLSNEMPESLKTLFGSYETPMEKSNFIVKFQIKNCLSLLKQTLAKYDQLKIQCGKLNTTVNLQKNEIHNLKEELATRV